MTRAPKEHIKIDLRSDTCSRPTPEMRGAMADAEVGDDVYPSAEGRGGQAKELLGAVCRAI
jgi:threonine aldolase